MKSATIYKIKGIGYLIHSHSKTSIGLRVASEPFINLPEGVDNDVLADAIKTALCNDDSKRIPHPKDWKQADKEFMAKTGLKSSKSLFSPKAKCLLAEETDEQIIFTPTIPAKKPDSGFLFMGEADKVAVLSKASNQEIFSAFELALSRYE
ncbi:hypothetical protein IDJ77_06575 [Mucilaginibacter sp. ZT4R22]|uniref:Uncharacterized protein n=1 Tax=Mucilaginibacter pankratovii TaxID=2772110 RepID=A0ABR7WQ68_9SPHI|nr:hypothetical protein [Mucilaginibacter pankratovii]MBD1363469.1 hypothetical protein [Mucilaginibacter pankratovii]